MRCPNIQHLEGESDFASKGRGVRSVRFSDDVDVAEIQGYDNTWLQKQEYRAFAADVKISVTIFRTLRGFVVDSNKFCFRGIESYLVSGQSSEERNRRRAAIDAVLTEYKDQYYVDINDPEKVRLCLEPASIDAARRALSRAATDAVLANEGTLLTQAADNHVSILTGRTQNMKFHETNTVMYLEVQAGNFGTVYLNDFETPIIPEFQRWLPTGHSPTSSGLKAGDNELRILVRDTGGPAGFQYHMKVTQETAQS